jgi:branched-chain amino acid transport system ATP-binding protein
MTEPSASAQPASASAADSAPAYLAVNNMHAHYGESYIVQGISLAVNEGEILALLGRNGAGKTTTLRTIARLDDPQLIKGELWLDGARIDGMSSHQAAVAGIGLVPEDRRIIAGLTVEENLQLAQITEPVGWSLARIYDLFPRLEERRKQEGITLSGGEQQMLSIARALARKIKVLYH